MDLTLIISSFGLVLGERVFEGIEVQGGIFRRREERLRYECDGVRYWLKWKQVKLVAAVVA